MMSPSSGTPAGLDGDLGRGHQRVRRGAQPDGATGLSFPGAGRALCTPGLPHPRRAREGGRRGHRGPPGCSLDLHVLLAHGDRVEACQGFPHGLGPDDPDGPWVAIERPCQGHDVRRRVAAAACGCRAGPATLCWRTPLKTMPPNERHHGAGASRLASARASGVGALWAI